MKSILEVTVKVFIGFIVLLILTRILGKKQVGQLTTFNYVTGITMGNMAGDMIIHKDVKLIDAVVGLTLWAVLTYALGYISIKSSKVRVVLNGEPAIVIKKGVILHDVLAVHRVNMDDLSTLLRSNNIFSIKDVEYAILEPNGQLSVLKNVDQEPVTRKDMQIQPNIRYYLPSEIIVDGKVVDRNLKELGLSAEWLGQQLKQEDVSSIKDIFYGQLQEDGSLYIIRK